MTGLLKHRIQTLVLKEFAAFPSQTQDSKDMIKEWRREQRCRLVRSDLRPDGLGAGGTPDPVRVGDAG